MKKQLILLFLILITTACTEYVDVLEKPLSKNQMAEIIAEMTLRQQELLAEPGNKMQKETQEILKKHKIKAEDFTESYKYYIMKKEMDEVLNKAQGIIQKEHPDAKKFIEKKLKEHPEIISAPR
ncbi:MAG: DUF4296 domain-containing protein [Chryseobacterium sp.]|nr:DUF4296 domain-containing protein [Chryseobacterium sp.]